MFLTVKIQYCNPIDRGRPEFHLHFTTCWANSAGDWHYSYFSKCLHRNVKSCFLEKKSKKKNSKYYLLKFLPRIISINSFPTSGNFFFLSSADNLCKQFGPRSGSMFYQAWSGSKLFDTLMVFWKIFLKLLIKKKICRRQKIIQNYPACK